MKRSLITCCSLVLLATSTSFGDEIKGELPQTAGKRVENFRLLDQAGQSVELYRTAEAPAVVLFTHGIGCPVVRRSVPELNRLKEKYAAQGVVFYLINANTQDSRADLAAEADEFGLTIPILKDPTQRIVHAMGSTRTAEALVLDPKDKWKILYRGPIDDRFDYGTQKDVADHRWVEEVLDAQLAGTTILPREEMTKGCLISFAEDKPVSYAAEVAPILAAKCVSCHTKGGVAPFAMSEYKKVKGWSDMIRETLRTHRMPPWHADPAYHSFHNSLDLTAAERGTLLTWIEQGAERGDGEDPLAGVVKASTDTWNLGTPDHVVQLPKAQSLAAEGVFDYRYVTVPSGLTEDKWLRGVEVLPTKEDVVHHALIFIMYPPQYMHLQPDPKSGLDGFFASYLPGGNVQPYPTGTAQFVPAGSTFIFQMHYNATGKEETDQTRMGLYFYDGAPKEVLHIRAAAETDFAIPAQVTDFPLKASFRFDDDATLLGLSPHMHYRGSRFSFEARFPDDRKETLLSVPWYEFDWQPMYYFDTPLAIPSGTRIVCEGAFDNSPLNPRNPNPDATVYFGEQSHEEMFIGYLSYSQPYNPDAFQPAEMNPDNWEGYGKELTEAYLTGTTWAIGDKFRLRFEPAGKLIINDRFEGTWRFDGTSVHVTTSRRDMDLEIVQDTLRAGGRPMFRIPGAPQEKDPA